VHSYVRLWRVTPRPTLVRSMRPDISFVTWGTLSRDGKLVAASGYHVAPDGSSTTEVAEWSAATGRPVGAPTRTAGPAIDLSLGPADELVAVGYFGAQMVDPSTKSVVATVVPSGSIVPGVAFSPDGSTIATADADGFLRFSDAATGQLDGQPLAISQVGLNSVAWSPDGRTVVTSDWAGNVRLTDVASGLEIGAPFEVPEPDAPFPGQDYGFTQNWLTAFTPNGDDVVVSDDTGRAWVFPVTLGVWEQRACQVANRNLTQAEWARYVPGVPYQDVCPAVPSPIGG
jgi:WD40 repeat protein